MEIFHYAGSILLSITISKKYDAQCKEQVKKSILKECFKVDYPYKWFTLCVTNKMHPMDDHHWCAAWASVTARVGKSGCGKQWFDMLKRLYFHKIWCAPFLLYTKHGYDSLVLCMYDKSSNRDISAAGLDYTYNFIFTQVIRSILSFTLPAVDLLPVLLYIGIAV